MHNGASPCVSYKLLSNNFCFIRYEVHNDMHCNVHVCTAVLSRGQIGNGSLAEYLKSLNVNGIYKLQ